MSFETREHYLSAPAPSLSTRVKAMWPRAAVSTRPRILSWYMLLMALALAIGLFAQRSLLLSQMDGEVNSLLRQEVEE